MENLKAGYEFPAVSYELTRSMISGYEAAVEAHSPDNELVPPLAIAAYSMKALYQSLSLPPGSIHASQEFEFVKPVAMGTVIQCSARVIQNSSRGGLHMMVIELNTVNKVDDEIVLSGKTTAILPGA